MLCRLRFNVPEILPPEKRKLRLASEEGAAQEPAGGQKEQTSGLSCCLRHGYTSSERQWHPARSCGSLRPSAPFQPAQHPSLCNPGCQPGCKPARISQRLQDLGFLGQTPAHEHELWSIWDQPEVHCHACIFCTNTGRYGAKGRGWLSRVERGAGSIAGLRLTQAGGKGLVTVETGSRRGWYNKRYAALPPQMIPAFGRCHPTGDRGHLPVRGPTMSR